MELEKKRTTHGITNPRKSAPTCMSKSHAKKELFSTASRALTNHGKKMSQKYGGGERRH